MGVGAWRVLLASLAGVVVACGWGGAAWGQLTERPGTTRDHPLDVAWDLSGRSIKEPRIRAVADPTGELAGSSTWFVRRDPVLAYAMGRNLLLRDWRLRDGVFGEEGRLVGFVRPRDRAVSGGGTLPRDDVASCGTCHNVPFGEIGAGVTMAKDAGAGRNTPHLYGAGLLEMLAERLEAEVLAACDADRDGWIGAEESRGRRVHVEPTPGAEVLDFGGCGDEDNDGLPDVDRIVRPHYVDARGRWVSWAQHLRTEGVAGWVPEAQVFGHGQLEGGLSGSLRAIIVSAADVHMGLQARDPTLFDDPDGDGRGGVSPSGRQQLLTLRPRDRGALRTAAGVSRDDPDRDGFLEELTEGDVDLAEHFLLHMPQPVEVSSAAALRGRATFLGVGCGGCHVPDWEIGQDRRLFRLDVSADASGAPTGRLVDTSAVDGTGARRPSGEPFRVRGIFSDLRKHDVGPDFYELGFDGTVLRRFRTPPLWGVGTTGPWGHDGASLDLLAVILRHGGEALDARRRFEALGEASRLDVLEFLRSLRLYPITDLPTDTDGDGLIDAAWSVAGRPTGGPERFNPELLAAVPCAIEGWTRGANSDHVFSKACTNVDALYRLELPARRDQDRDGFPDLRDDCPQRRGFLDGCAMPESFTGP